MYACTCTCTLSRLSRGTGGASGKRQVTADMSDIMKICFISLSSNISTRSIGRPIQNWKYIQVSDRGQTVSLPLVFAEQEWTKSFMTGGFAYVGLADNDD